MEPLFRKILQVWLATCFAWIHEQNVIKLQLFLMANALLKSSRMVVGDHNTHRDMHVIRKSATFLHDLQWLIPGTLSSCS